ncbi:MAG TPA: WYL domain-containing protein, partial [Daejeonella sp.]
SLRQVHPYALKEFRGRWYILAKDLKDNRIKTFGLDRIQYLEITKKRFTFPSDLNVGELFRNCFGIINPDDASRKTLFFRSIRNKESI